MYWDDKPNSAVRDPAEPENPGLGSWHDPPKSKTRGAGSRNQGAEMAKIEVFRGPACYTHGATLGNGTKGGFECARGRYLLALATPPHLGSIRSRRGGDLTRARPVTHYKTWIFGGVPNSGIAAASRRTAKSPAGFQIRPAGVAPCEFGSVPQ